MTADPNKLDLTLLWTTLTASGPVAWLIAIGITALMLAMAWRLVRGAHGGQRGPNDPQPE